MEYDFQARSHIPHHDEDIENKPKKIISFLQGMNDRLANEDNGSISLGAAGVVDGLEGEDSAVVSLIIQQKTSRVIDQDKHLADLLLSSSSDDDDERENIREQRLVFKNFMLGVPAVSISADPAAHPRLSSPDKIVDKSTLLDLVEVQCEPRIIVIAIEDFSFVQSEIVAAVGDILQFKLTDAVPFHAEHLLHGESDVDELCFDSPILQVKETREFLFPLVAIGEIHVCCLIYSEMVCKVTVLTSTDALQSIAQHNPGAETFNQAVESSDSSFLDSDDHLSAESLGSEQLPDHNKCYIQEDEALFEPLLQQDNKDAAVSSGTLRVLLREFSRADPPYYSCKTGDVVVFERVSGKVNEEVRLQTAVYLECDGEFKTTSPLTMSNPSFSHVFKKEGFYQVKYVGNSFVVCHIMATHSRPAACQPANEPTFDPKPVFHVPAVVVAADEVYLADEQENDEDKLEDEARIALRRDIKAKQAASSNENRGSNGSSNSPMDKSVNRSWDMDDRQKSLQLFGSFLSVPANHLCNQDDPSRNMGEEKSNDLPEFSFEEISKQRDQEYIQLSSDVAFLLDSDEEKDTTNGKSLGLNTKAGPSSSKTAKKRRNQRKNKKGKGESAEQDPSNDHEVRVEEVESNDHTTNFKADEPKQADNACSAEAKVDEYQDSTAVIDIVLPLERTESEASDNDDPVPSMAMEDQYVVMDAISQHNALENNIFEKLDLASLYSLFDVDDVEAYLAEREQKIEAEFVPVTNPRKLQRKKAQNSTQDQQSKIVKEQTAKIVSKALPKRQKASDGKSSQESKALSKVGKRANFSEGQRDMVFDEGSTEDLQRPREALTEIKEIQDLDNRADVATEANLFIDVVNESHPSTIIDPPSPSSAASVSCECILESPQSTSTTDPSVLLTALSSAGGSDENALSETTVQIECAASESPSCDRRSQLLSVLGLKELISKPVIEEVLGLKSSLSIPSHDPVRDQDTASSMQLSSNEVDCEPGCALFMQRYEVVMRLLSSNLPDHLPSGRSVPVLRWPIEIESPEPSPLASESLVANGIVDDKGIESDLTQCTFSIESKGKPPKHRRRRKHSQPKPMPGQKE